MRHLLVKSLPRFSVAGLGPMCNPQNKWGTLSQPLRCHG
jgi:hypothetical protein